MKNGPVFWGAQFLPLLGIVMLLHALVPLNVLADGCFVVPKFVWDKQRDINEPTQKAIIAYEPGHEEMLLQVKYDGPPDQFGWLIPVPSLPTVSKGSMACFYELSKFTQKNLETSRRRSTYGAAEEAPPVKVVEVKTVGAYDIAVLSAKDSTALEQWLKQNQFVLPTNADEVIAGYVKRNWYFIAVKIGLEQPSTAEKLASGELNPLQISFASEQCVFPLKISSLNHTPSEVQIYVLSPDPLIEPGLFNQDLAANYAWRTNRLAGMRQTQESLRAMKSRSIAGLQAGNLPPMGKEPDYENSLELRSMVNQDKFIEAVPVERKDIPVCSGKLTLLKEPKLRWLIKVTRTFQPDEMRDLEFVPAVPLLSTALADPEGAFAAGDLNRLGTAGAAALIAGMQNTNAVIRAHAMAFAEDMTVAPAKAPDEESESERPALNPALARLLPTLLGDPDPGVRLHAVFALENSASPAFFDRMLKMLRDDNTEVSDAAASYLRAQRDEIPKHVPLFRQMLKDTNENVQIAAVRLLMTIPDVDVPRNEWLALFSVPRMEVAGVAVGHLRKENITTEEAEPLLHNDNWVVRMVGLAVISPHADKKSVELALPLLRDPVEVLRSRAHDLLMDLTGQNFPMDQPAQWEEWWEQNKASFAVSVSPDELRQKRLERSRSRRQAAGPPQ